MNKITLSIIIIALSVFVILECYFVINCSRHDFEEKINLTNTECIYSIHIGRKLFLHECIKNNKSIFDLRYFWKHDLNDELKADIVGIQMSKEEFIKICTYCPNV